MFFVLFFFFLVIQNSETYTVFMGGSFPVLLCMLRLMLIYEILSEVGGDGSFLVFTPRGRGIDFFAFLCCVQRGKGAAAWAVY